MWRKIIDCLRFIVLMLPQGAWTVLWRNKFVACLGLAIVTVLSAFLFWDSLDPPPPPIPRMVGLKFNEAGLAMIESGWITGGRTAVGRNENEDDPTVVTVEFFTSKPDWLGRRQQVNVYSRSYHCTHYTVTDLPRVRPPWLVRTLKLVGW